MEQPPPPLPEGWRANTDPATGNLFYHCDATGESTWTRPAGQPPSQVLESHFPLPSEWCQYIDAETGASYFHCTATGETTWERPIPAPPCAAVPMCKDARVPGLPGAFIRYLRTHPHILDSIRTFQAQNRQHFSGEADGEFSLGATSSYNEFVALIDMYLQPFLTGQGATVDTFVDSLRQLKTTDSAHFFAFNLMLERMDFPEFARLMRSQTCLCCGGFFMGVDLEGTK